MVSTQAIRVGVIEDHPLYRAAVARVLEEAEDIELGAVADSVARFAVCRQPAGSVVVLDLKLRGIADAAAVMEIVGMGHKVLVVSAHAGQSEVLGAISAGARGYLSKDADGEEILRAIREIASGNSYVSPTLASFVLNSTRDRNAGPKLVLSERERQVLSLVAAGERDQDIAEAMSISVRTVRSYLDRIRDKTGRRRRPELTRLAIEEGIAHPS
ncbi:LuxR C-terminal-related transcriptional regulator [Amycolatopsis magusensis]|uniref:DNA-binding NarL/FixJ family response regulator n=1 Tax=Amycolatopsis magusensis TaxID=882444 RepID=A0ABS4Q547_9PSEU|nr:response regulator transcription factor [Amycolatopsis magusensis]MBP2186233.1 DNA-binding NarL/FixJ family response regulator [Amycolatopsis magusensis]MDI5979811.1 response regulator transcription factor [Amycolatopsis magusensis]